MSSELAVCEDADEESVELVAEVAAGLPRACAPVADERPELDEDPALAEDPVCEPLDPLVRGAAAGGSGVSESSTSSGTTSPMGPSMILCASTMSSGGCSPTTQSASLCFQRLSKSLAWLAQCFKVRTIPTCVLGNSSTDVVNVLVHRVLRLVAWKGHRHWILIVL